MARTLTELLDKRVIVYQTRGKLVVGVGTNHVCAPCLLGNYLIKTAMYEATATTDGLTDSNGSRLDRIARNYGYLTFADVRRLGVSQGSLTYLADQVDGFRLYMDTDGDFSSYRSARRVVSMKTADEMLRRTRKSKKGEQVSTVDDLELSRHVRKERSERPSEYSPKWYDNEWFMLAGFVVLVFGLLGGMIWVLDRWG